MAINRQVPRELGHHQPGQHAASEGALLHGLRGLLRRDDLVPLPARGTGVGVAHVLDDVRFGRLNLQLLGHACLNDDALLPAAPAGTLLRRQRIFPALPWQELGEHNPFPATLERAIAGCRCAAGGFVGRFLGLVFRPFLVGSTVQRRWREQLPLIRVRCKALTTRREEGLLQQRDLLGSAFELLAIVLDRHLLLAHELLQLTNHPLAVGHTLRKIGTSVLHALLNPAGVESVSRPLRFFKKRSRTSSAAGRAAPALATPHTAQFDPFEDQSQITDSHLNAARRRRRVGLLDVSPTARRSNVPASSLR